MNTAKLPTTIPEYLEHLRRSLAGADPATLGDWQELLTELLAQEDISLIAA